MGKTETALAGETEILNTSTNVPKRRRWTALLGAGLRVVEQRPSGKELL
jgi:hypothetical protein